jgi:hypothetical protein
LWEESVPTIEKQSMTFCMFLMQDVVGMDMPRRYGAYQTAWRRLKWWSKEVVWNKILVAAQEHAYAIGKHSLEVVAVDSTLIDSKKAASQRDTMDTNDAKV